MLVLAPSFLGYHKEPSLRLTCPALSKLGWERNFDVNQRTVLWKWIHLLLPHFLLSPPLNPTVHFAGVIDMTSSNVSGQFTLAFQINAIPGRTHSGEQDKWQMGHSLAYYWPLLKISVKLKTTFGKYPISLINLNNL